MARWLLSSRVEELLAASSSRQVPLIPGTSVPVGGLSIEDLDPLVIDWDDAADALPAAIQEAERYLLEPLMRRLLSWIWPLLPLLCGFLHTGIHCCIG